VKIIKSFRAYGMATLREQKTNVPCFIELRPQPDSSHKQVSIKVRILDANFKTGLQKDTAVIIVSDTPVQIKSGLKLSKDVMEKLVRWITLNKLYITKYWLYSDVYTTDELFSDLKPIH